MSTASVSDLKARLSEYLREIKRGGEVQVLERGVPIARLTAISAADPALPDAIAQRRRQLIAAGTLRPGTGRLDPGAPIDIDPDLGSALEQDREDRL
ncbi:MAG: type II toxin-antitoxin system prevent-host-death family antitoxin [Wenzhouxiangellaceae bacterium]|nr:type II toxin-antitoxin system prevent-host-death family antitoxin [Wenzhouxiangellaceae bacterium]